MQTLTLITAVSGLVFGLIGAVLGVINFLRALSRDKLHLRVIPSHSHIEFSDHISITVINDSVFAVTIEKVGLELRPESKLAREAVSFRHVDQVQFPHRLESRASMRFTFPARHELPDFDRVIGAYADTACGKRFAAPRKSFLPIIQSILKTTPTANATAE